MGPLLVCSGMQLPRRWLKVGASGFNGAAARVQRNAMVDARFRELAAQLQWGRCSCAAE